MTALDREIMRCVSQHMRGNPDTCWIFDPDNQPSTAERLRKGEEFVTWYVFNGQTITFPGGSAPLSSEIVPCPTHLAKLEARVANRD